ncbi:unnamed protein product [Soboliphyme baturini]|uniref:Arf-GAP domain-containing protein n=1 Tax=Soboliphyme baturini TaxID=241478 RepID=A0A183J7C0_9BILA|nr:unnamed protein product [Soboliphyme baturini]
MYGEHTKSEPGIKERPGSMSAKLGTIAVRDNRTVAAPSVKHAVLEKIYAVPGNDFCADCGSKNPKWASINFGVTLCIECCAIHRSLSVQVSKVRSLLLDDWEPEHVRVMTSLGNVQMNGIYCALPSAVCFPRPATPDCNRADRKAWIVAKYVKRHFLRPLNDIHRQFRLLAVFDSRFYGKFSVVSSSMVRYAKLSTLKRSCSYPSLRDVLHSESSCVAYRGAVEFGHSVKLPLRRCMPEAFHSSRTTGNVGYLSRLLAVLETCVSESLDDLVLQLYTRVLHCSELLLSAVRSNDLLSMAKQIAHGADVDYCGIRNGISCCEYLLLNGANLNKQDLAGDTPLHLAVKMGHTGIVCLLLKRGANQDLFNCSGESPLAIGTELANADIVTLLRLAKLNDEIKTSESGSSSDVAVADVFRDFSDIANRRQSLLDRREEPDANQNLLNRDRF